MAGVAEPAAGAADTISRRIASPAAASGGACPDTNSDNLVNVTDLVNVVLAWGTGVRREA